MKQEWLIDVGVIKDRLDVLYASVEQANSFTPPILRSTPIPAIRNGVRVITYEFESPVSDATARSIAIGAINSIVTFQNHVIELRGNEKISNESVLAFFKQHYCLRLMRDIHNREKHPQDEGQYTKSYPTIKYVKADPNLITLAPGESITWDAFNPSIVQGRCAIAIGGPIMNEKTGALLSDLRTLLDESVSLWEGFIRDTDLLSRKASPGDAETGRR